MYMHVYVIPKKHATPHSTACIKDTHIKRHHQSASFHRLTATQTRTHTHALNITTIRRNK